jgi:transposase
MDASTVSSRTEISPRQRVRRAYTLEQKRRVVAEACVPGASVALISRRHGINANLIFNWCRQHRQGVLEEHTRPVKLVPVEVTPMASVSAQVVQAVGAAEDARIEIALGPDVRISISGVASMARIAELVSLLRRSL